jgi:phosphoribosyl-ATP pyrophosphohydrolase
MDTLARLEAIIADRHGGNPDASYVAKLLLRGVPEVARKVGEEAVETAIAAVALEREDVVGEAADLIFHLLILLRARGIKFADVLAELDRREGTSGIDEKAARSE